MPESLAKQPPYFFEDFLKYAEMICVVIGRVEVPHQHLYPPHCFPSDGEIPFLATLCPQRVSPNP